MSEELKPCPFCGNNPLMATMTLNKGATVIIDGKEHLIDAGERFVVTCSICGATTAGLLNIGFANEDEAISSWNKRLQSQSIPDEQIAEKFQSVGGHVYSKRYFQLLRFIAEVKSGKEPLMAGLDYVVMSKRLFDKINKQKNIIEASQQLQTKESRET